MDILLFSQYRIANGLELQKAISEAKVRDIVHILLYKYISYLRIVGYENEESIAKINEFAYEAEQYDWMQRPGYRDIEKPEFYENINSIIDNLIISSN